MMKALFVGRFQPFHKAHLRAVLWIFKKYDFVYILIGSINKKGGDSLLTFSERKKLIENVLTEKGIQNFKIFGIADYKKDSFWAKKVFEIINEDKKNITVFTRNDWTTYCFDLEKVKVKKQPIFLNGLCATSIRKKIKNKKEWKNLVPDLVYQYLHSKHGY